MSRHARVLVGTAITGAFLASAVPSPSLAQSTPASRVSTTVGALVTYPVFFHAKSVRLRGTLTEVRSSLMLTSEEMSVLLVGPAAGGLAATDVPQEVAGTFLDTGRLSPGDPRLATLDIERLSKERLNKDWPGVNELPIVVASTVTPADPFPAPSVRALALTPNRYGDSHVTVSGRFRARNLLGDQPDAPGRSQWDFVLGLADASVWVVGMRPRGSGFDLRVDSRVDTNQWLEVSGTVRQIRRLVVLEATAIRLAKPLDDPPPAPQETKVPAVGPPPEVVFSFPTGDETDVRPTTRVRVQLSRDLDPSSLRGKVRAAATTPGPDGSAAARTKPMPLDATVTYDEGLRVIDVRFAGPLPAYSTITIELLDGIKATDGAAMLPWTLTFTTGG